MPATTRRQRTLRVNGAPRELFWRPIRILGMDRLPIVVSSIREITDEELEARLRRLAGAERKAMIWLLIHLAEFDRRRLYADRTYPSLFAYCTKVLGYSEQGACKRIQAARAAARFPVILERLSGGDLNLAAVVVLAPHMTSENVAGLLEGALGKRRPQPEQPRRQLVSRRLSSNRRAPNDSYSDSREAESWKISSAALRRSCAAVRAASLWKESSTGL